MKIKLGEYVRTKNGSVGKVIDQEAGYGEWYELGDNGIPNNIKNGWALEAKIAKHSKNIIDLIEVGDLVETEDEFGIIRIYYIDENEMIQAIKEDLALNNFKIKSILTHEQYKNNAYRLEE